MNFQFEPNQPTMNRTEKDELIASAINHWGADAQLISAAEELGELLVAMSHRKRGRIENDELITELADASIMMEVIMKVFNISREEVHEKINSQYMKFKSNYDKSKKEAQ